jgi:hypothetical protein
MSNTTVQNSYTSYTTPATLITLDAGSSDNKITVAKDGPAQQVMMLLQFG